MAFENCISEIVAAGKGQIDEAEARRILGKVFDRATRHERDGVSRADAAVRAARELGDEERIAAAIEKRGMLINKMRRKDLDERVTPGKEAQTVRGLLDRVDAEAHGNAGGLVGGLIADLRKAGLVDPVFRRDKDFERDVGRELWRLNDPAAGTPTGNKFAVQTAEILHRWQETGRQMENAAGAHIGKLDHYVTRQSHDMEKISGPLGRRGDPNARFQEWRDFIEPKLDERTFEGVEDRNTFLRDVWQALATGIHETVGGGEWLSGFKGPANLAKKISQERKLHFNNADDWLSYNERFGRGNVVDSILHGLERAGRNTALMHTLGTNPKAMYQSWVEDLATKARDRNDIGTARDLRSTWNEKILDTLTGQSAIPDNLSRAQVSRWIRTAQSLSKLGGVVLSSFPDLVANVAVLRHNGVPLLESYANTVLSPLQGRRSGERREIADLLGVGMDGMKSRLMSRFAGEDRFGTSTKLVEAFHRINFLSFWTDSLKTGVGLMLSHNLARNVGREFAALHPRLQATLRLYDIDAPEWNAIRQVERRAADGKDYVLPGNIADLSDEAITHLAKTDSPAELGRIREDLRAKLHSYMMDQSREAMTEPRASDRTMATFGTQAGTAAGEAIRLLMQFKQYPITFTRRHMGREFRGDRASVMGAAHLVVATTLLGYVSMTAKEYARGRNPRQPDEPQDYVKLVSAAMLQGGGAGIYGDFLFGEANRVGGGLVSSLAGPTAGTLEDAHKLYTALKDGSSARTRGEVLASEGTQILKSHAPFVNLFYTRTALDYFIMHRLQEAANPGYLRRYEQKVKKENDQTFWLRPTASPY